MCREVTSFLEGGLSTCHSLVSGVDREAEGARSTVLDCTDVLPVAPGAEHGATCSPPDPSLPGPLRWQRKTPRPPRREAGASASVPAAAPSILSSSRPGVHQQSGPSTRIRGTTGSTQESAPENGGAGREPVRALGRGRTSRKEGLREPDPLQPPRRAELRAGGRIRPHGCPFRLPRPRPLRGFWPVLPGPRVLRHHARPRAGKGGAHRGVQGSSPRMRVSFETGVQRRPDN